MNLRSAITSIALCLMLLIPSVGAQPTPSSTQPAGALQQLSADFWEWRAAEQPFSFDDIPRLDRPRDGPPTGRHPLSQNAAMN